MIVRVIVFKFVLFVLVVGSAFGLAIRDGVQDSLRGASSGQTATRAFRKYPLPLGFGCAAVAFAVAFGDVLLGGRRKAALPTYTDEEFLAKFGGSPNAQQSVE
jgi:hypothetical protein